MQPPLPVPPADSARAEIDTLYTPLDEALAQLPERRANENLRVAVTEFHRACPTTFLRGEPLAFLGRYIQTPNREFERFVTIAKATGLSPFCGETPGDIFCGNNRDKCCLLRPAFEMRPNHLRGLHIMDGSGLMSGKKLNEIRLKNGMGLSMFHHALHSTAFPEFRRKIVDFSEMFSAVRREEAYYFHYLALFVRDGILFENFLADDAEELRFARERVLPSFARAVELFGVRPLIVPLLPRESEGDDRWRCHDGALYPHALNLLRQPHAATAAS